MSDWRTKNDMDLTQVDIREMRQAAIAAQPAGPPDQAAVRDDRTVNENMPSPGPWDEDIEGILVRNVAYPDVNLHIMQVRGLMQSAWQFGYTTGMADSAKLENQTATEV